MKTNLISLLLALLISLPAAAFDLGGGNVLIPIAGRAAGAFGSQWRTDLVIANLEASPINVHISFYAADGTIFVSKTIAANGTLVLEDVIQMTLGRETATGLLRVNSATPDARFTARAYVYNRGNMAGEFGQGVTGVPVDALSQEHTLAGIAGTNGRRTNVGIANPWPSEVDVIVSMHGPNGELLAQDGRTIEPLTVLQINDVFSALGVAPRADASLRVHASLGVYPYASVVRNDTGDAVFVAGSGIATGTQSLTPLCSEPAALLMPYRNDTPAEQSVVVLRSLGAKQYFLSVVAPAHGITVDEFIDEAAAFRSELTDEQIKALRCETTVKLIRRDGVVPGE